jgi:hypothetical protein
MTRKTLEIKKGFQVILEGLSTMASYSDSKNYDLDKFTIAVNGLFLWMRKEKRRKMWIVSPITIEILCNYANSVRFNFTKKGFKLVLPKNLNLGFITNK